MSMPMIVREGQPPLPVVYDDWAEWRVLQRELMEVAAPAPVATEFCAACWGQGRFFEAAANGEGLVPRPCGLCGGSGTIAAG